VSAEHKAKRQHDNTQRNIQNELGVPTPFTLCLIMAIKFNSRKRLISISKRLNR